MGRAAGVELTIDGEAGDAVAGPAVRFAARGSSVRFWAAIARGLSSEDAAVVAGVSSAVGIAVVPRRWRHAAVSSARCRAGICRSPSVRRSRSCSAQELGVREIARGLGRSPSTISRELRRNAATRGGRLEYRAGTAQWHAERRARRPKTAKLAANDRLREYVQDRLAGEIDRPDGEPVPGPDGAVHRAAARPPADRRWAKSWSPEQISNRLQVDFPDDESMRIWHEAIYQALYVQGRGALRAGAGRLPAHRAGAAGAPGAHQGAARSSSPRRS